MVKSSNLKKKIEIMTSEESRPGLSEPSLIDTKSCLKTRNVVRKAHREGLFQLMELLQGARD